MNDLGSKLFAVFSILAIASSSVCVRFSFLANVGSEHRLSITEKEASQVDSIDQKGSSADSIGDETLRCDHWSNFSKSDWEKIAKVEGDAVGFTVGIRTPSKSSVEIVKKTLERFGGKIKRDLMAGEETEAVSVTLSIKSVSLMVRELSASGLCRYIEPNRKLKTDFVPNDPSWPLQWGPKKIQADFAWNTTKGTSSVLVAVVDTGIDYNHPDLASHYVALGRDWVNDDEDPLDDSGHGTHCAGIIGAVIHNGVGIAGLAQVKIMAEKILDSEGYGYEADAASAIIHAASQGARIISCSFGGDDAELNSVVRDAIRYAQKEWGVLIVASAGNSGTSQPHYPAYYDEVVAVSATDSTDGVATFSSFGNWVDVAAPGVNIYSTMPTYEVSMNGMGFTMNYSYMSGTSMACPHVSGVAALILSVRPDLSLSGLRQALYYATDDLGDPGFDTYYGYGRINAKKAVEQSRPEHDLVISKWSKPNFIKPDTFGRFNVTVYNFGMQDEENVSVELDIDGIMVDRAVVPILVSDSSANVTLSYCPHVNGTYAGAVYVRQVQGETNLVYNTIHCTIDVGIPKRIAVVDSLGTVDGYVISNVWDVLNTCGRSYGDQLVQIDYASLNKTNITYEDIKATKADALLISDAEEREYSDQEIEAIYRYVYDGHGLVITATLNSWGVPNNMALAPLVGLNDHLRYKWGDLESLNVLDPAHPLFKNVSASVDFTDSGTWTSTPEDNCWSANQLQGGTYLALGSQGYISIVEYRGCIYISTFLEGMYWYGGVPLERRHDQLQLLYNALAYAHFERPEHELVVFSVKSPSFVRAYSDPNINATIRNVGFSDEVNVSVLTYANGSVVSSIGGLTIMRNESFFIPLSWQPTEDGLYNVTVHVVGCVLEDNTWNNVHSVRLIVGTLPDILVVADCFVHEYPESNTRSSAMEFSAALIELGIQYYLWNATAKQDTPDLDFISKFKLVIWTCGGTRHGQGQLTDDDAKDLIAYVNGGGRLLLEGDQILYCHRNNWDFFDYVTHAEFTELFLPGGSTPGLQVKMANHPLAWGLPENIYWRTDTSPHHYPRYPNKIENARVVNGGVALFGYIDCVEYHNVVNWKAIVCSEMNGMPSTLYLSFPFYSFPDALRTRFVSNVLDWFLNKRWWPHITMSMPNDVEPSQSFNLNITVQNVTKLTAWELELYYRTPVLNLTAIVEGSFLSSVGTTVFQVTYHNDSYSATKGCIRFRCHLDDSSMSVNGSGLLATIILKALATGKGLLTLGNANLTTLTSSKHPYFYENIDAIVGMLGDVNGDHVINILDVVLVTIAYGSRPGYSYWNPIVDLVPDDYINILDLVVVTSNYGKRRT